MATNDSTALKEFYTNIIGLRISIQLNEQEVNRRIDAVVDAAKLLKADRVRNNEVTAQLVTSLDNAVKRLDANIKATSQDISIQKAAVLEAAKALCD